MKDLTVQPIAAGKMLEGGVYSGKKRIVYIHGRNEYCLFREEMNSVYSGKK
jgi:hypothetical protein